MTRVGIVGSGYEVALLASWLPDTTSIDCFVDRAMRPWSSKSPDDVLPRMVQGVHHLVQCGVDAIIVPPIFEGKAKEQFPAIFPLFDTYMKNVVLPASRVGKLGLMSVHGKQGMLLAKQYTKEICLGYNLTSVQQATKKFDAKFPYHALDLSHWNLQLPYASRRSRMMRNLIKYDLRYFKDCDEDSLIPCDRGLLYREKMIRHRLGARMKFHGSSHVQALLAQKFGVSDHAPQTSITLHSTANSELLLEKRERKQLFDRGGKREIVQIYVAPI